jgi:hypothetical protein
MNKSKTKKRLALRSNGGRQENESEHSRDTTTAQYDWAEVWVNFGPLTFVPYRKYCRNKTSFLSSRWPYSYERIWKPDRVLYRSFWQLVNPMVLALECDHRFPDPTAGSA